MEQFAAQSHVLRTRVGLPLPLLRGSQQSRCQLCRRRAAMNVPGWRETARVHGGGIACSQPTYTCTRGAQGPDLGAPIVRYCVSFGLRAKQAAIKITLWRPSH